MTSPFADHHRASPPVDSGPRRLRAASTPPPPLRDEHRCRTCGRGPANPLERITMTAQWLLDDGDGPVLRRFCPDCRPTGPIHDLTCSRCGDGPLLAGDLAATDPEGRLPDLVERWLTNAGWHTGRPTGIVCPTCSRSSGRSGVRGPADAPPALS